MHKLNTIGGDLMAPKNSIEDKVIVITGKKKVDLVKEVLGVIPDSLILIDQETLFGFTPDANNPGNAADIDSVLEQLEKRGIKRTVEMYRGVAKALNILIRSGRIELRIYRDRVFHQTPLAISLPK